MSKSEPSRHCSDELLLAYLDRELSLRLERAVKSQLGVCWQCRARLGELEQQAEKIAKLLEEDHFPGPGRILDAQHRFLSWCEQDDRQAARRRESARQRSFIRMATFAASILVCITAIGIAAYQRFSTRAPRATVPESTRAVIRARPPAPISPPAATMPSVTPTQGPPRLPMLPAMKNTPQLSKLNAAEIHAQYVLHRAGACLGEPIEVVREPEGFIKVRGIVQTLERKDHLNAAFSELASAPLFWLDLKTTENVVNESRTRPNVETASVFVRAGDLPIQRQLDLYFGQSPDQTQNTNSKITRLADEAVTKANSMFSQAWALRRLIDAYSRWKAEDLQIQSAWLVEVMIQDHLNAFREENRQMRKLLEPVLVFIAPSQGTVSPVPTSAPDADWSDTSVTVFQKAESIHKIVNGLFAGDGLAPEQAEQAAAALLSVLPDLDRKVGQLEAQLAREFPGRPSDLSSTNRPD